MKVTKQAKKMKSMKQGALRMKSMKRGPARKAGAGRTQFNKAIKSRSSASTGKLAPAGSKGRKSRPKKKEAPGPLYSGKRSGTGSTSSLARGAKSLRLSYRNLAGMSCADRVRAGVKLGYLKKLEGKRCPEKCGAKLTLSVSRNQRWTTKKVGNFSLPSFPPCRYYCSAWDCEGNKHGFPVENDGAQTGLPLGGNGRAPAGEGLLCLCLATQPWAANHPSRNDCSLIQGIGLDSMQFYLDVTREAMARLNIAEQQKIKFKRGALIEWDECGIRAEQIKCPRPCLECGGNCLGYRLQWNRWIIGVERGNRKMMVIHQLPWKTSAGDGGGVPLAHDECDAFCLPHLGKGVICLTDGAEPYEAFAGGQIVCSPECERGDCLTRAQARGEEKCCGYRPRGGRDRYKSKYESLQLAHGVVCHKKEEWALVKKVRVTKPNGKSHMVSIKHGTEVADGAWQFVKEAVPSQVHSSDHDRIAEYVHAWAWKARRHGEDIFQKLGQAVRGRN